MAAFLNEDMSYQCPQSPIFVVLIRPHPPPHPHPHPHPHLHYQLHILTDAKTTNTWRFCAGVVPVFFDVKSKQKKWIGSQVR
jgi:hypothetical protein